MAQTMRAVASHACPPSCGGEGGQRELAGDRGVTRTLPPGKYKHPGYGQCTLGQEAAPLGVPQSWRVPHMLAPAEAWPDPVCTPTQPRGPQDP